MDTIFTLADAWARQFLTTVQDTVTTTWTWLAAQPVWVVAVLVLATKGAVITGIVLARRRHRHVRRVAEARERAAAVRTGQVTPKAARASRAAGTNTRRSPFTPAATASQARELVVHGVPALEISRRTGLSRDAVSLLLSQAGRRDRQGRPSPAGLSPFAPRTTTARPADLRA